ncbi:type I restriction enzyme S subunit [Peptoniphilus koenoeneniae]|uniref:Type I restriction enzyme S subunit n=1 Tax=Peptoniphilus koenoeneniae TaxID=507751 RepID=A0ABU0AZ83_9FIRM|nr:restriction endonuclease subunit S [Peptoniphilus koenoeneniae]MDQ0275285.1 type I restriction enzyme S subunit [Peptoniphilus koenoeneniae]
MAEWKKYTLEEVCERIYSGGTPSTKHEEYWNGNIKWLSSGETSQRFVYDTDRKITKKGVENSSTKLATKGCTVIATAGQGYTRGQASFLMIDTYMNQSVIACKANESIILPLYLYYNLDSRYEEFRLLSDGTSTRGGLSGWILKRMEIKLPPISLQEKIVDILYSIDKKIEENNAINNNLEQQAKAIFTNEFLSTETLPDGWKQGSLIDIADYLNGLAMQKYRPSNDETGIPVLKIKELRQGCCDDNSELCSPNIKNEYIVHDGDVIFSWSGSLLVDFWCGGVCGLNQHLFKVTSNSYDKWFYYAWTKHHLDRFIAVAADKATTMGHIKRDELAKAEVIIPSIEDYNRIGALLQPIYDLIISNRIENKKLAETRDSLLPKLMSGEIDMSEVDYE